MSPPLRFPELGHVLDGIGEGVTVAGADGRIVYSNVTADEILGLGATDTDPSEWADYYGIFLPDGSATFPSEDFPLVRALSGEMTRDVEMLVRNESRPAGALIAVTGRPIVSDGEITGAVVVFRDVTELRAAERWKEAFFAFALHDLKNPLTAILGLADLMLADSVHQAVRTTDLNDLRDAAMRMTRMVRNMLDLRLAEDGGLLPNLEPVSVPDFLDDVHAALHPRVRARGQWLIPPECQDRLHVLGDQSLLLRVMQNLVDNCMKYGPDDGKIWLEADRTPSGSPVIRVRDQGPGVPPELRERIFDMYATTERTDEHRSVTSSGLGLRFCSVIAEAHRGRIWVENALPTGAVFNLELPAA